MTSIALLVCAALSGRSDVAHAQSMSEQEAADLVQQMTSADAAARLAAAENAGLQGHQRLAVLVPPLRRLLREDADWRVQAAAGRALGRLEARQALPDLVRAMRHPRAEVRVVAAAALWRMPDLAVTPTLIEGLNDADPTVRSWCARALGSVRDRRGVGPLIALLDDADANVRVDGLRSLGRLGDPASLEPLVQFAANGDRGNGERAEAVQAIAAVPGDAKTQALIGLLTVPGPQVRVEVARALGRLGDPSAVEALRAQVRANRGPVRAAILEAIRQLTQPVPPAPSAG